MFSLHVNCYKLKQEVLLDQCCLHLVKWSINPWPHTHAVTLQISVSFTVICSSSNTLLF